MVAFFVLLAAPVEAANQFPTSLNNWSAGQKIESDWANQLEAKIGVNNSAVTTSLDYILKNAASLNPGHVHSFLVNSNNTGTALSSNAAGLITVPGSLTATGLTATSTFTLGSDTLSDLTGSGLLDTSNALTCATANASTFGCLLAADWTVFNTKVSSSSLSATSPLSYNSSTGVFSISQAGYSTNGFLASADFTEFKNKVASTSLSATSPLSYNSSTGVFSISQASQSSNGYLSSGDFTIFNNKVSSSSLSAVSPLSYNSATGQFSIQQSTQSQAGYLGASDFVIFNNKVSSSSIDTSSEFAAFISGETGSGSLVFDTDPTFSNLISVNGAGTSTFTGGVQAGSLNITGAASSTFANGIQISAGCYRMPNGQCVGTGSGSGTVSSGVSGFLPYYSSTGTTIDDTSNLFWDSTTARLGIGSTSPTQLVAVQGNLYTSGTLFSGAGITSSSTITGLSFSASATSTLKDLQLGDCSGPNRLCLVAEYNYGSSAVTGGMLNLINNLNKNQALVISSSHASPAQPLVSLLGSSATFGQYILSVSQQGTSGAGNFSCDDTNSSAGCLAVSTRANGNVAALSASNTESGDIIYGLNAGGNVFALKNSGFLGLSSTTPQQRLSVQGNGLFSGDLSFANGTATGTLTVKGTGTSTFSGGIQTTGLMVTSATSTFANGLKLAAGNLQLPVNCSGFSNGGTLTTDSGGNVICASDEAGGGSGTINSGTTNRLPYYSGATTLDSANFLEVNTGTSLFTVHGNASTSQLSAAAGFFNFINASSTTGTSTFARGLLLADNKVNSNQATLTVGSNYRTADYTTLQAAINALPATGGTIHVQCGTYTLSASTTIAASDVTIEGEGDCTDFRFDGTVVSPAFAMADGTQRQRIHLRRLKFTQTDASKSGVAINLNQFALSSVEDVTIRDARIGILMDATTTLYNHIVRPDISVGGTGAIAIKVSGGANENTIERTRLRPDSSSIGLYIDALGTKCVNGCEVETGGLIGIDIGSNGHSTDISGIYLEANQTNLRIAAGVESVNINGGNISNATNGAGSNLVDLGAKGLSVQNVRVEFDPVMAFLGNGANFGIGTTSPQELLHVVGNLRIGGGLGGSPTGNYLAFFNAGSREWRVGVGITGVPNTGDFGVRDASGSLNPFIIKAAAPSNLLFLDAPGKIGVASSAPFAKLSVGGDILGGNISATGTALFYGTGTSTFAGGLDIFRDLRVSGVSTFATTTMAMLNRVVVVDGVQYAKTSAGIQNALNVCSLLSCSRVHLPEGTYDITGAMTIAADITVSGDGERTNLFVNSSVANNVNIFANSGSSIITIRDLKIDGNQANRTAGLVGDALGNNIHFTGCTNCHVERVTSVNATGQGVSFTTGTNNSSVKNSVVKDNRRHNILLSGASGNTTRNVVEGNFVSGAINFVGIELASTTANVIKGNVSTGNAEGGVHVYSRSHWNTISGNTLENNSQNGISIVDESNFNTISGNIINNNSQVGISATVASLTVYGSSNTIVGNTITNNGWNGIRGQFASSTIEANIISNNGRLGASTQMYGTYITTGKEMSFSGNQLRDNTDRGAYFADISDSVISGNVSKGHTVNYYFDSAGTGLQDSIVSNNKSYGGSQNGLIFIKDADNNTITGNHAEASGGDGFNFRGATQNTISNNVSINHTGDGMEFRQDSENVSSSNNYVSGNVLLGNATNLNQVSAQNLVNDLIFTNPTTRQWLLKGTSTLPLFEIQDASGNRAFAIDHEGNASSTRNFAVNGLLITPSLIATSMTATSTFAGGLSVAGGLKLSNLNCSGFTNSGKLTTDSSGNLICGPDNGGGGSTPAGNDGELQYNNGGAFGGASGLVWDDGALRLGIGTATPVAMLSVQDNALISGTTTTGSLIATSTLFVGPSGSKFSVLSNGNVGINTASPANRFVVNLGSNEIAQLNNGNNASAIWSTNIGLVTGAAPNSFVASANNLNLSTGATRNSMTTGVTRVTILSNGGFVGIGTTSPMSELAIQGVGNFASTTSNLFTVLNVPSINATSTTATSTFSGGVDVAGGLQLTNLNCSGFNNSGKLTTDSSGNLKCADDTSTAGSASVPNLIYQLIGGTKYYTASSTATDNLSWYFNNGFISYASSTFASPSASTTFAGGIRVTGSGLNVNGQARIWKNSEGSAASQPTLILADDTRPSLSFESVGENTGMIGLDNLKMVINTERDFAIRVDNSIGDLAGGTEVFTVKEVSGNVGLSTSTPGSLLSIQGVANFAPGFSQLFSGLKLPGLIATSTLTIPNGADPTVNALGLLAINTNAASSSVRFHDGTAERSLFASRDKSIILASSTLAYLGAYRTNGTTTVLAGNHLRPLTVLSIYCKTDTGTAYIQLSDGTNKTETVACTTTGGRDDGSLVNNTWVMREDFKVDVGSQSGNPNSITISLNIREDAD